MRISAVPTCLLFVLIGLSGCYLVPGTPDAAFHEFQTTEHKESFIVAPLCTAGELVVPLVIEKIKDRNLERRIYAIGFLGTTESRSGADALETIARDETESESVRHIALQSLFMADENRGLQAAKEFQARTGYVGRMAKEILAIDNHSLYRNQSSPCNITD